MVVNCGMRSELQAHPRMGRLVVKRTFLEVVDCPPGAPGAEGFSSRRVNSDSALFTLSAQEERRKDMEKDSTGEEEGHVEFDLSGLSDTDTNPEVPVEITPLPCYCHLEDDPQTTSSTFTCSSAFSDSVNDVGTPPLEGVQIREDLADCIDVDGADASDLASLQRLLSENERLALENVRLRERLLAQAIDDVSLEQAFSNCNSGMWYTPLAPTMQVHMPVQDGMAHQSDVQGSANQHPVGHESRGVCFGRAGIAASTVDGTNEEVEHQSSTVPLHMRTTVMLRNLPNNYNRAMVLAMLNEAGFEGCYDFLYLPIDFNSHACLGYSFVNLTDPSYAQPFWDKFDGFSQWILPSRKVCRVSWSGPHQGYDAHVARYRNSPVMHASVPDEYKPVLFSGGVRIVFPPPTKVPRAPRVRHHVDHKAHRPSRAGRGSC